MFSVAAQKTQNAEVTKVEVSKIPAKVVYQLSRLVGPGRLRVGQPGIDGIDRKTFVLHDIHGKVVKHLIKEERTRPVDKVVLLGRGGYSPSRGAFNRQSVRVMLASGYDPSPATIGRHATGRTCTGRKAEYGCIAVDPRVIPFGTLLYVEGYGLGIASDRGSAIKGNRIDLCFNSKRVADAYGMQHVRVHFLKIR